MTDDRKVVEIKTRRVNGHAHPGETQAPGVSEEAYAAIEGERPPLVEPRVYDLRYRDFATVRMFGRAQKLVLWFTIAEPGDFFDVALPRYYNIARIIGQPQQYGRFKVGFTSDFFREYARLFGAPGRLDRVPMSAFENQYVQGKVRTVATGRRHLEIPEGLRVFRHLGIEAAAKVTQLLTPTPTPLSAPTPILSRPHLLEKGGIACLKCLKFPLQIASANFHFWQRFDPWRTVWDR